MGNTLIKVLSKTLDCFGVGINISSERYTNFQTTFITESRHIDDFERVVVNMTRMVEYCKSLVFLRFYGQTSLIGDKDSNEASKGNPENLGVYLQQLDQLLRRSHPKEFNLEKSKEFLELLKKCAFVRTRINDGETFERCYSRLLRDGKRFEKTFKDRAERYPEEAHSEELETTEYWGTRQQLLSAKVICDWICEEDMPPMDPIFGVLLNPTAGRVGPGDSGLLHNTLFDNNGQFAFHSAVHDAFGYLLNFHETGPGYDYMNKSLFSDSNPLAGQVSGLAFWNEYIEEVKDKLNDPRIMQFI